MEMPKSCSNLRDAVFLFVDGLPMEMTWKWLLQILKGKGDIIDVYVLRKRRSNNAGQFGFVHFKSLEEASKAVRNLNGAIIRGRSIKVSYAKYDKNGMPWKDTAPHVADHISKIGGRKTNLGKLQMVGEVLRKWW